jgi:acetyl esterase
MVSQQAGPALIAGFLNGFSRVARLHPRAKPHRHDVEHIRDIRYLEGTATDEHLLDVWRPTVGASVFERHPGPPWPVVVYVHGGAFRILSKDTHWVMGLGFARRGFVVFNVSYRLAPKHRYPAALEDVCRAFAWIVDNAASFGGDPSRIVLAGESAGANLVTSLAMTLAYERPEPFAKIAFDTGAVPRAVVPACGVFQVTDLARLKRRKPRMSSLLAEHLVQIEHGYLGRGPWPFGLDLADPLVMVERGDCPTRPLPPFFLPVGTRDPLLPDTRRLAAALRALGGEAVDRYYPGEIHAFHALVMRERSRGCWRDIYAFLDRHVPMR